MSSGLRTRPMKPSFGVGHGVGEGLREVAIAGILEDAELLELERAEVLLVVGEAGFGGGDHVVDIVGVGRCGVDLDVDRPGDPW